MNLTKEQIEKMREETIQDFMMDYEVSREIAEDMLND